MSAAIFEHIEFTQYYLLLTCIFALFCYRTASVGYHFLLLILSVCFINETLSTVLLYLNKSIGYLNAVNVILHNSLWVLLLGKLGNHLKWYVYIIVGYVVANGINIIYIDSSKAFDIAFISGALIYLSLFLIESFTQLKKENFLFFTDNNYILLFAPVLFFFGISFICGFVSKTLAFTKIFGEVTLYQGIGYVANIVYYTLINIYVYREKKLKNAI